MFAKVIAGVVAAVVVTGVGIYVSNSDSHGYNSCCPISRALHGDTAPASTETPSCCAMPAPTSCSAPEAPNESLGACMGSTALVSTNAKTKTATHTCCSE